MVPRMRDPRMTRLAFPRRIGRAAAVVAIAAALAAQATVPASASPQAPHGQPGSPAAMPGPGSAAMSALRARHGLPAQPRQPVVPGHLARPQAAALARHVTVRHVPAPVFPQPGTAVLSVPAGSQWARAASLPVQVAALPPAAAQSGAAAAARVRITVAAHATAAAAGSAGLMLALARADGGTAPGRVRIRVSYAGFESTAGGGFGARLMLAAMPACALTNPAAPACRAIRPVPTLNDAKSQTLTATVPATPAGSGPAVYAATSTASGGTGDFKATPLTPASQWQVGLHTGDFTYSYPLRMPPPIAGAAPLLALSYDSGVTDGQTAQDNSQPGQLGQGFSLAGGGYIERKYAACADHVGDSANTTDQRNKTGDLCYDGYNGYLSLDGHSGQLIDDSSTGTWKLAGDDGSTVKFLSGASNGAYNGRYWEIITPDGTQYWFGLNQLPGWGSGDQVTNSVWTVPVAGLKTGDPCHASAYASSYCANMPWRWNLDLVVDPNGNATSYYYSPQTNYYAYDSYVDSSGTAHAGTPVSYTSGGTLTDIYYGSLDNTSDSNNVYAHRPFDVQLGYSDRCTSTSQPACDASHTQANWPDTPWDLYCSSASGCTGSGHQSPAFFDTRMLTSVTTSLFMGSNPYQDVDTWKLAYEWLPGDNGNSDLGLYSITRSGDVAGTASMPPVTFGWTAMGNKAYSDGYPQVVRNRLTTIVSEAGARTGITYNTGTCGSSPPSDPAANTLPCFPQYWTPGDLGGTPQLSWFYKYTVRQVTVTDTTGGEPPLVTTYQYCKDPSCSDNSGDGAAWHYDTDIDLVPAKHKSYGQWRGYQYVHVLTGSSGGTRSETDYTFLRGMDGDPVTQPGGGFTYPAAHVTPSRPSGTLTSVTDANVLDGSELEKIVLNGPGGAQVSDQVTWPWTSPRPTATSDVQPWGKPLTAFLTGTAETDTYTPLSAHAGGGTRQVQAQNSYDSSTGLLTQVSDLGDVSDPAQAQCTAYTYPVPASTAGLLDYPAEAKVTAGACGTSSPPLISDTQYLYDGQSLGTAPTAGNITRTQAWSSGDPGVTDHEVYQSRDTYDSYGRRTSHQDAAGNTTTTRYTSSFGVGRPTTQTSITSPLTSSATATATTDIHPEWGLPADTIDASGQRTDYSYDPLGRVTSTWLPGQTGATRSGDGAASYTYDYSVSASAASAVTTRRLVSAPGNAYTTSVQLYDALLRPRQAQTSSDASGGGMEASDIFYDSRGNTVTRNGPYDVTSTGPSATLWVTTETQIPDQNASTFDGANRVTETDLDSYGALKQKTTWTYPGGDAVTETPPAGGTITAPHTDGRGRTSEIDQYHSKSSAAGAFDATRYAYTPAGKLSAITDAAGNTWTYSYDLLGRQVSAATPDTGTTASTYNDLGQLTSTTDAQGKTISYAYDAAGRKTAEYNTTGGASQTASDQLAAWTYDTATLDNPALPSGTKATGQPASSTAYTGGTSGSAYTETTGSYSPAGQPDSVTYTIPSNATTGALAGSYTFSSTYNADGTPATQVYPSAGGLPAETVVNSYDGLGYFTGNGSSLDNYVAAEYYTSDGQPSEIDLTTAQSADWSWVNYTYDTATLRLAGTTIRRQSTGGGDDTSITYGYDPAGNLTSAGDSVTGNYQCLQYDYLARLTAAWAQGTSGCPASPPGASGLGGPAPYQQTLSYDQAGTANGSTSGTTGDITSNTLITGSGSSATTTATTQTFPAAGATQPHTSTAQSTTVNGGTPATTTLTWTAPGRLTTVKAGGTTTASYTWNGSGSVPGQLFTATTNGTTTSYRYDAAGNLLIVQDGTTSTLYLPGEELTTAGSTVTATRYYTAGSQVIAARTPTVLSWLIPDPHGTATTAISTATQALTRRYYTPFGVQLASPPPSWPGTHGYIGGTADPATGLTNLGAREYNPATPGFLTPDPVLAPTDPTDLNPYDYAGNNPATNADPTGLYRVGPGGCGPQTHPCPGSGGGGGGGNSGGGTGGGCESGCPGGAAPTPAPATGATPRQVKALNRVLEAGIHDINTACSYGVISGTACDPAAQQAIMLGIDWIIEYMPHFRMPDYTTASGSGCREMYIVVCGGLAKTVTRYHQSYIGPSVGVGSSRGGSIQLRLGWLFSGKIPSPRALNNYVSSWSADINAAMGNGPAAQVTWGTFPHLTQFFHANSTGIEVGLSAGTAGVAGDLSYSFTQAQIRAAENYVNNNYNPAIVYQNTADTIQNLAMGGW
jgi:RHS repeat-associated protein